MSFPADVFSYRMFRFPVDLQNIISSVEGNPIASEIHLEQNFPNPFNGYTAIRYQVSAVSSVRLVVYDLLGREVRVLVHEVQSPGTHNAHFAPDNVPSGFFVYRLQVGNVSKAGRMLFLK
jgi:hypothetical protein